MEKLCNHANQEEGCVFCNEAVGSMICDHCSHELKKAAAIVKNEKKDYRLCKVCWIQLHNNFFLRLEFERKDNDQRNSAKR